MIITKERMVKLIFRIEIFLPSNLKIISSAKMGVTNLQSKSENGRNKKCKI